MPTLTEKLQDAIDAIDGEMQRVKDNATTQLKGLQQQRATLIAAQGALLKAPEAEQLIPILKTMGVL